MLWAPLILLLNCAYGMNGDGPRKILCTYIFLEMGTSRYNLLEMVLQVITSATLFCFVKFLFKFLLDLQKWYHCQSRTDDVCSEYDAVGSKHLVGVSNW